MHGNLWEWCLDSWHENYDGAPTDGSAWEPDIGSDRIIRSSSWWDYASDCKSSDRFHSALDSKYANIGFRIVEYR
jgi:formylglycine-generating enzyme required for sulfatase activity